MRFFLFLAAVALAMNAQDRPAEVSASFGAGVRGAEDIDSGGYTTWSVGGGYRLSDRWIVRGEFSQHRSGPLNLFSGSVMREWDGNRGKPFVEAGIGAGWWRQRFVSFIPSGVISGRDTNGYLGVNVGAGVTYEFFDRYFVRPQARLHIMGPIYVGIQPAIAAGVRL